MLLFSSEEHVDKWCHDWGLPRGGTLSLDQGFRLARAWYGQDRRDPEWSRPTVEETESFLAGVGLKGPFWDLRQA